jgi:hypothetical protein
MSDSVYSHDTDEILITGFRAKRLTNSGGVSPVMYEAIFQDDHKAKYLAIGYGEKVQTAVTDLYRNYRDIRARE